MPQNSKTGNPQPPDSLAQMQKRKQEMSASAIRRRSPQLEVLMSKDWVLSVIVFMCIGGVFFLAINGRDYGEYGKAFIEITKYVIAAFFGRQFLSPR